MKRVPRQKPLDTLVAIRLPTTLVRDLDREVARRLAATPGARVTRSSVVREVVFAFLRPAEGT